MAIHQDGFDVEGPVQAEVFVVWLIEVGAEEHPVDVVSRIVRGEIGEPILVHSTSWRRDQGAIVLTFLVAIDPTLVGVMDSAPIERVDLARSAATAAPHDIAFAQVLEHGLRHLAWLIRDDPVVARGLAPSWESALSSYVPEPFRALG